MENITLHNDKLYFIDWERASKENKESDPERILRQDQRKNSNLGKVDKKVASL